MANPNSVTTTVYGFGAGNQAQIGSGSSSGGITPMYTARVGFFGTTPATQQSTTLGGTVVTTVAVSTTTGSITSWGFSTSTQANNVISLLNSVYGAMTTYGLLSS